MHDEILSASQRELLPLMERFRREYYLVGGTAIAMHIGHRRSIDFDMFKMSAINHKRNLDVIAASGHEFQVTRRVQEHMDVLVNGVKVTFFQYPFPVTPECKFGKTFRLPSLLSLAVMKAYALGRRSKWKDYVDLYFLLAHQFSIEDISERASELFGPLFSEKQFRAQLAFFDDIDYSETVDYLIDPAPSAEEIKAKLTEISLMGI